MRRGLLNLSIDLLAALCLLVVLATGYVLRFPLPPTTNRTHELWGFSRHEWGLIHSWASLGLLLILAIHVVLHWEWIFTMIRRRFVSEHATGRNRSARAGFITATILLVVVGAFAVSTHLGVREREVPLHPLNEPAAAVASDASNFEPSPAGTAPAPEQYRVEFVRDVAPIFQASCISCHGPGRQLAGFRADLREHFFSARNSRPLVVPGDPDASRLLEIVSGRLKGMKSAAAHLLSPGEIAILREWIETGANWENGLPGSEVPTQP